MWALPLFRDVVLQAGSLVPAQVGGLLDLLFYPHLRLGIAGTGRGLSSDQRPLEQQREAVGDHIFKLPPGSIPEALLIIQNRLGRCVCLAPRCLLPASGPTGLLAPCWRQRQGMGFPASLCLHPCRLGVR